MKTIAAVLAVSVAVVGAATASAGAGRTAGGVTTVHVVLGKPSEMRFSFDRSSVRHGTVVFELINKSVVPHDLRVDRRTSPLVAPAAKGTLRVTFAEAGRYPYECTVPGHAAAGMKGVLTVT
jgi:uncharacterized cupredoxin-like copper-binding protein